MTYPKCFHILIVHVNWAALPCPTLKAGSWWGTRRFIPRREGKSSAVGRRAASGCIRFSNDAPLITSTSKELDPYRALQIAF
jgi:hypothetical protein